MKEKKILNDLSFIAGQWIEYQHIDVMKEKKNVKVANWLKNSNNNNKKAAKKTYMRGKGSLTKI